MIRLRDKATGAEAEWEMGEWSGDPDFVSLLELLVRAERLGERQRPHESWGETQLRMTEQFPKHGIVAVKTTPPAKDYPSVPGVVN